jgi:hypothetical protein
MFTGESGDRLVRFETQSPLFPRSTEFGALGRILLFSFLLRSPLLEYNVIPWRGLLTSSSREGILISSNPLAMSVLLRIITATFLRKCYQQRTITRSSFLSIYLSENTQVPGQTRIGVYLMTSWGIPFYWHNQTGGNKRDSTSTITSRSRSIM